MRRVCRRYGNLIRFDMTRRRGARDVDGRRPAVIAGNLDLPVESVAEICRRYDVQELSVFGSVLRDDFRAESDMDFLVVFRNGDAGPWLSKFTDMEHNLSELLGRKVDLVDKRGVERSENYIRRRHILDSARTIYVA